MGKRPAIFAQDRRAERRVDGPRQPSSGRRDARSRTGERRADSCGFAQVARAITSSTRSGDTAARYGGEEFLVIILGASLEMAPRIGERYRRAVAQIELPTRDNDDSCDGPAPRGITVSIGVAAASSESPATRRGILAAADEALYKAKVSGRDRVVVHPGGVVVTLKAGSHSGPARGT